MQRRVVRRGGNRPPMPVAAVDVAADSDAARQAFAEQRTRSQEALSMATERETATLVSSWFDERARCGLYNIDHGHVCRPADCWSAIEMIGDARHGLYGCRTSGLYHVCKRNVECGTPQQVASVRNARRNFTFADDEMNDCCVFSRSFIRRTFSHTYQQYDAPDDHGEDLITNPPGFDMAVAGASDDDDAPAPIGSDSDVDVDAAPAMCVGGGGGRKRSAAGAALGNVGDETRHQRRHRMATAAVDVDESPLASPGSPLSAGSTESVVGVAEVAADASAAGAMSPVRAAIAHVEFRQQQANRRQDTYQRRAKACMAEIRTIVMHLCYSVERRRRMLERVRAVSMRTFVDGTQAYIAHCRQYSMNPVLSVLWAMHAEMRRQCDLGVDVPSADPALVERVSGIVYRAWLFMLGVNRESGDARTRPFRAFAVAMIYQMCNGYEVNDQAVSGGKRAAAPGPLSALLALSRTDGAFPAIAGSAAASSARHLLTHRTDGTASTALVMRPVHDGDVGGGAVIAHAPVGWLGNTAAEYNSVGRRYTILPRIDALSTLLPPQAQLYLFGRNETDLTEASITLGMRLFRDAVAATTMCPDDCSRYIQFGTRPPP